MTSTASRVRAGSGWRQRLGAAALGAVLACAPLPAVALAQPVGTPAVLADWGAGSDWSGDWSGGWSGGWGGSSGTGRSGSASTVDSDPATDAESVGVVLIDTVLGSTAGGATAQGAGTGMVLTADGQVLTNYHVVEGATQIRVTVASTGQTYQAIGPGPQRVRGRRAAAADGGLRPGHGADRRRHPRRGRRRDRRRQRRRDRAAERRRR